MIQSTDLKFQLSGGSSNADPNASLGGAVSSTEVVSNTLNNLFALAGATEAETGSTKYRAIFVKNTHATLTAVDTKIYIASNTTSSTTEATIALAGETGSPIETVANENTAPSGETFVTANGVANALTIGDLAPGEVKGVWIKWVINASTNAVEDVMTITARCETEA